MVDDHEVVLRGLRQVLEPVDDLAVVGAATTAAEAVALAAEREADVVLMDLVLPDHSGCWACRRIRARQHESRVLFLTAYHGAHVRFEAAEAGASGCLFKEVRSRTIVRAIRRVGRGELLFDQALLDRSRDGPASTRDDRLRHLTPREQQILALLPTGRTNREIADELQVCGETVKHGVSAILDALGATCRTQAAAYYLEHRSSGTGVTLEGLRPGRDA